MSRSWGQGLNPVCVMEEVGALLVAKAHAMVQQTSERWMLGSLVPWHTSNIQKKQGNRNTPVAAGLVLSFSVRRNQLVMARDNWMRMATLTWGKGHLSWFLFKPFMVLLFRHPSCKVEKIILKRFCVYHLDPFWWSWNFCDWAMDITE